ncbi:hypothetical protein [Bilophila wadsworthia]|uniref:hypothetical protein n=1 Tax=Bilophila wadsworthia TaxID=35833 RepID=UPI003521C191
MGGSFGIHAAPVVAIGVQHIRARLNRDAAQKREQGTARHERHPRPTPAPPRASEESRTRVNDQGRVAKSHFFMELS